MINYIILVWMHFVADFIMQTNDMAVNKSKSNAWLFFHVSVYCVPFMLFSIPFALINLVAHFITDFITSRLTSYLWKRNERHSFFVVIGFDQAVHLTTLFVTYQWLIK